MLRQKRNELMNEMMAQTQPGQLANTSQNFRDFTKSEFGAVTVDWLVLTAFLVGLAILSIAAVRVGVFGVSSEITTSLVDLDISSPKGQRVASEEETAGSTDESDVTQGTHTQRESDPSASEIHSTDGDTSAEQEPQVIRGTDMQRGARGRP